ncbi:MAG: WG repeat-containing protein [Defluviitaleaceae bacterium]|nr:WG repeat-containing protein [Defluviitaleaceae bacterium]
MKKLALSLALAVIAAAFALPTQAFFMPTEPAINASNANVSRDDFGNWGIVDNHGNLLVPFVYEHITAIWNRTRENGILFETLDPMLPARFNGMWGFIDHRGNVIMPFISHAEPVNLGNGRFAVASPAPPTAPITANNANVANNANNATNARNAPNSGFERQVFDAVNQQRTNNGLSPLTWDSDLAAIARLGNAGANRPLPPNSNSGRFSSTGANNANAVVNSLQATSLLLDENFTNVGIGRSGRTTTVIFIVPGAPTANPVNQPNLANSNLRWGVVDAQGNVIIDIVHNRIQTLPGGLIAVETPVTIPNPDSDFHGLNRNANGTIRQMPNNTVNLWGIMDTDGNLTVDFVNRRIGNVQDAFVTLSRWDSELAEERMGAVVSATGATIIPFEYGDLRVLPNGFAAVSQGGNTWDGWGLINFQQTPLVPMNYSLSQLEQFVQLSTVANLTPQQTHPIRIHWDTLRGTLGTQEMQIMELSTGRTVRARSIANGNHADVRGINDHYQQLLGTFAHRAPVLVTVGGQSMAASIGRYAPSEHFCLHFFGSTQNNNNASWGDSAINRVEEAVSMLGRYRLFP